jgi:hypothetical protein
MRPCVSFLVMRRMLPVIAMVLTATAGAALAQPRPMPPQPVWDSRGWVMLGERTVNGRVDHDRIEVGRYEGRFNRLTMVVENSDLELIDFRIVFGDRTEYHPKLSYVFRDGQRTRAIDLPPSESVIRSIDIQYRNLSAGEARVQVWGFRTGNAAPPPPPPAPPAPPPAPAWDPRGWTLLGERTVDGRFDHDRIDVGRYEGRFSKLTMVVENSDLELVELSIKFDHGPPWQPSVGHFFREGQRTRAIDFPGEERIIKHIDFRYRNLPGGGRARVAVYGLREAPVFDSRGWAMLGERTVDSNREDYDRIEVPRRDGRFRKLMVVVLDGDLEMIDMLVELGHGEPFHPEINALFRENTRTRAIDLPGEERRIHGIQFRYRNLPGGAHARVQVWAR